MRIYFTGHRTFGNRGCEAIVRSTVALVREVTPHAEFLVPSDDIGRDSAQWPDANDAGVTFVGAYFPRVWRPWAHFQRLPLRAVKRAGWPFRMPDQLRDHLSSVDLVLAIGGDNYSLDYRLPSLFLGVDAWAMDLGKPVVLWGASVGPFDSEPDFRDLVHEHLRRMNMIGVRESVSHDLLAQAGLTNVFRMPDPAFTLKPQPMDAQSYLPIAEGAGIVGLNVSPLLEKYARSGLDLKGEIAEFVRRIVKDLGFSVLFVPHVMPLDGSPAGNDLLYMQDIFTALADVREGVGIVNQQLNAAQFKYLISRCRFFLGGRTHATIAALSSGVPTVSIAYSVKARGINQDLFGHQNTVLPTQAVDRESLTSSLSWLIKNEDNLRGCLGQRLAQVRQDARQAAGAVVSLICA